VGEKFKTGEKKMNKKFLISIIFSLLLGSAAFAQVPLEMAANSMNPIPNGPTTAPQTAELVRNPGVDGTLSGTTVTASLSSQQFTGVNTTPDNAVVMFGATDNPNFGETFARPRPTFAPMSEIGSPVNAMFSNDQFGAATGIDVNVNYAFNLFTSVQQWAGLTPGMGGVPATNARVQMATITLNFSRPLNNPYLHIVAIGARSSDGKGFATGFDLVTAGITLEKVTGTASLSVTPTSIDNGNVTGIDVNCPDNSAACGTVRLRGQGITSVTFNVFVKGDNELASRWGDPNFHTGDQWMMGVSVPGVDLTLTAATGTISGRINNPGSRNFKGITLVATALSTGAKFYATPDSSGIYRFVDLPVNDSYLIQTQSRYFRFEPDSKVVNLSGDLTDVDFTVVSEGKTRGR